MTNPDDIAEAIQALKANRPLRAEEICRDHLLLNPGSVQHLRLLGTALVRQNRLAEAEEHLREALTLAPELPQLLEDLGSVLTMQQRFDEAIPLFERALALEPRLAQAHRKLAQALAATGRGAEADSHFEEYFERDEDAGAVAAAVEHLQAGRVDDAINGLQGVLRDNPRHVDAMRFLALAYWRHKKNYSDAEAWLRRATQQAPDYLAAWMALGPVLLDMNKHLDAVEAYRKAVALEPENAATWAGLGNALAQGSYPEKAIEAFERSVAINPDVAGVQMAFAHALKTVGEQERALGAYRAAIAARPKFGEVYWSMANLKVFQFEEDEVAAMHARLDEGGLSDSEEIHFRFALGKAYEDAGDYPNAWQYYHSGNQKQRPLVQHDALELENRHDAIRATFTRELFAAHPNAGRPDPDPILIVGLPRSGSTLVEQILASHSQVEGTSELPILGRLAAATGRYRADQLQFPHTLADMRTRDWQAFGAQYLEEAARHRQTNRPFFTDKMPNNFPLVGLLHLILPNARVINARRHPMDCVLGCYKQLFARGQNFTYDLEDLAHYYQQYDAMIEHWHTHLPGKVLDVHYEDTVADLEGQVRRILDHCGLPFEAACVQFHENKRAVKTASSEQVREPIFLGALGRWQRYGEGLAIVEEELRDIIAALPQSVRDAAG